MPTNGDEDHLKLSYEKLREKLLDMGLRNPMLSYKHRPTSKRQLQIIDEVPEAIFDLLADGTSLEIVPLPEPDDVPPDEKTDEFVSALSYAKATETEYLEAIEAIEAEGGENAEAELAKAERALRNRLRAQFDLPPLEKPKAVDPVQHARTLGFDPSFDLQAKATEDKHRDKRLQTLKFPKPLDAILEKIRSDARLAEQETGLSTLFLVFGFLEWSEQDSDTKLLAPLLLLPVQLVKTSRHGRTVYEVSATTTVAEGNLSLMKRVHRDRGITLPEPETDVENSLSVEAYFRKVSDVIADQRGWRVRRLMTLGHFMFGRFAMYADLDPLRWKQHPTETDLVGSVMRGIEHGQGDGPLFGEREDHRIDDPAVAAKAPVLIQDADASQHSALVDAMDRKNLVIQGPPGTGKSQTITNLIANALMDGRTVLFLAEKQAALDVVRRRLDNAGLGQFCLELHSDKASPKATIARLKERVELTSDRAVRAGGGMDAALIDARDAVSKYAAALNAETPDGKTPFGLMWQALKARSDIGEALDAFNGIQIPQAATDRLHEISGAQTQIGLYAEIATDFVTGFGPPERSAWSSLEFGPEVTPGTAGLLVGDLRDLRDLTGAVETYLTTVSDLGLVDIAGFRRMTAAVGSLPGDVPDHGVLTKLRAQASETVTGHLRDVEHVLELDRRAAEASLPGGSDDALLDAVDALVAVLGRDRRASSEIIAEAERTLEAGGAAQEALDAATPLMEVLGLRANLPCEGLRAAMVAAYAVARLPIELRTWFAWRPNGNLATALAEWRSLNANEEIWRGTFGAVRGDWPDQALLRDVAAHLRKGWLSRSFSSSGNKAAVASLAAQLGLPELTAANADALEELAKHVDAVRGFSARGDQAAMWGARWAGLHTPFEPAAKGQEVRGITLTHLANCVCGAEVAERVGMLDEDALGRLAAIAPGLEPIRRLPEVAFPAMGNACDQARRELPAKRAKADRILAADPAHRLRDLTIPLERLAVAVGVERERRAARRRLSEGRLSVAHDAASLDKARVAWRWFEAVEASPDLQSVREGLLGADAGEIRSRLRERLENGTRLADRLEEAHRDLRGRYGVRGLPMDPPGTLRECLDGVVNRQDELSALVDLRRQRHELDRLGLLPFVVRASERGLSADALPGLFEGLLARRRAENFRQRDEVLARAVGSRIQAQRRTFIDADKRKIENDRRAVRERLLARHALPGSAQGKKSTWTEGALLRNEMGKQQKFVPVRDLIRRASESLQQLTPCFMMSPLSLAKFLPRGQVRFDLLVIDEASQMKPEDALGGMLRAKQVVVVGDQKQLPPSEFFNRSVGSDSSDGDDEVEDIDDESILESCAKTFRETRLLKWHYRSRCESLIAFSNREFYDDKLITFPSAAPRSFSVELIRLKGRYEASRNPIEAQAVAEEAILFMRHHAEEPVAPSLGVVAVNSEQRDLIDEEIQRLATEDELVQRFQERVAERGEPFFVKNLENVQGDERDFIFVSMTYGPKEPGGPVMQRFGPINGKHGHRRLNVLFTRARLRIALFASFGSVDVKPSDTSPDGLRVLKRYFEYAERRGYAEVDPEGRADSDFEVEVARRLQREGFQVDHQVGVSGFRIDLGIRHPDYPERFIAGVECDGARYHSSKSARDRDRLREEVLTGLGWNILRVWSTDWFDNPDLHTGNLVKRLRELQAAPAQAPHGYKLATSFLSAVEPEEPAANDDVTEGVEPVDPSAEPEPRQAIAADPDPVVVEPAASFLAGDGPLNEEELRSALREFRDTVIARQMPNWEPHRSILREPMVETFVAQKLDDPDHWFLKVPGFQRSGTDPVEKRLHLDAICDLVARLSERDPGRTKPVTRDAPPRDTGGLAPQQVTHHTVSRTGGPYAVAKVEDSGFIPNQDRFYDPEYQGPLRRMVAYVIEVEGPIYAKLLIDRIARAHRFDRSGGRIVEKVLAAVSKPCSVTEDDGRKLIWPGQPQPMVPFRKSAGQERALEDVPVVELASIAAPLVARGIPDEEILVRMRDQFALGKLREATRQRFQAAVETCRRQRLEAAE
ncbi:DUF3320 domain-containing protein [Methylobacterium aerolatum]|uniref:Very-short-patch-repair endonuclease n=1 Tax=Methylobacterium aerolatum TaxID=418708 RepID=A0ABU0I0I9_9HYPH|nr:DUF3320 domain-containing protein [Methylobacterium aerolatum]MDQ0448119.1 very-short-patch-repair endonuclease [Methylobacterium aerolatum]GJD34012.1 ATP-dependent RecD-like DNA helicase [Methylobacterium aerolatum]